MLYLAYDYGKNFKMSHSKLTNQISTFFFYKDREF